MHRFSATSRTAVYGPVRTVLWEGRSREAPPIPIFGSNGRSAPCTNIGRYSREADSQADRRQSKCRPSPEAKVEHWR
jgi:hypothetical protein